MKHEYQRHKAHKHTSKEKMKGNEVYQIEPYYGGMQKSHLKYRKTHNDIADVQLHSARKNDAVYRSGLLDFANMV